MFLFFFFNASATTEIYTLSLHDALPIFDCLLPSSKSDRCNHGRTDRAKESLRLAAGLENAPPPGATETARSEEHTSELQSRFDLVCRLLLEKKKKSHKPLNTTHNITHTQ